MNSIKKILSRWKEVRKLIKRTQNYPVSNLDLSNFILSEILLKILDRIIDINNENGNLAITEITTATQKIVSLIETVNDLNSNSRLVETQKNQRMEIDQSSARLFDEIENELNLL